MAVDSIHSYQNAVRRNAQNNMNIPFKSNSKAENSISDEKTDSFETTDKPQASTAKKVGLGIVSCMVPGIGQLINGEVIKGLAFFGATVLTAIGSAIAEEDPSDVKWTLLSEPEPPGMLTTFLRKTPVSIAMKVAFFAVPVWAMIDAVRKAKPDAKSV